ncbi:MAG: efflux RND transporter periplasmic adaptor subunit [Candidatus Riflebacteria bacterium]|nr:efflux RND transporter periplasmic adaptor subunit [Candidatus Riflebacteria bacterium]
MKYFQAPRILRILSGMICLVVFLLCPCQNASAEDIQGKTNDAGCATHTDVGIKKVGGDERTDATQKEEGNVEGTATGIEELRKIMCEHKIQQLLCDKCRFELGAVKIAATQSHLIKLETLTTAPAASTLTITGETSFDENSVRVVTPRFCGRLDSMTSRVGDRLSKGAPVAQLESLELAEAALNLLKRRSERGFAEKKIARERLLREKKIGTEQDLQAAQAAFDLAVLEEQNAADRLRLFGIADNDISGLSSQSRSPILHGIFNIYAPIDGVVTRRDGTVGEVVPEGRALLTIADPGHLRVTCQAHERDMESVLKAFEGSVAAEIRCDAFSGRIFSGKVIAVDAQMAPETRTLPVHIEIQNHEYLLRPGQFVTATLYLESPKNLASLPISAVVDDGGRSFVFVQEYPEMYLRRDVVTGRRIGDRVAIQRGLRAGESIVTEGAFLLKSDILRGKMGAGCAD